MTEKWMLYEYVAILQPKEQKKDEEIPEADQVAKLILGPETILAKNDKQVQIKIHRKLPDEVLDDLDRVEILIRPFAKAS